LEINFETDEKSTKLLIRNDSCKESEGMYLVNLKCLNIARSSAKKVFYDLEKENENLCYRLLHAIFRTFQYFSRR